MASDTIVRARIDIQTKNQATVALAAMGLSVSDYIRMAMVRVAHDKAVPFEVKVPNALTAKTLHKSARGVAITTAKNADDLFKKLGI